MPEDRPDGKARREKAPAGNQRVVEIPLKRVITGYGWIEELGLEKLKTSKDPTRKISPLGRGIKEVQTQGRQVASNLLEHSNAAASLFSRADGLMLSGVCLGKKKNPFRIIKLEDVLQLKSKGEATKKSC